MPRFFTRLYGEEERAAISKFTYIWNQSSRYFIAFALGLSVMQYHKIECIFKVYSIQIFKLDSFGNKSNLLKRENRLEVE